MKQVKQIIDWLKANGEGTADHKSIDVVDEPWERFVAEWQVWGYGQERLSCGYYIEQNGDLVPDPEIVVDLRHGEIVGIVMATGIGSLGYKGHLDAKNDLDRDHVESFLVAIVYRHLANRTAAVAS